MSEVSVVTRAEGQNAATRLEFDRSGAIASQSVCARAVGTTVAVKDIFKVLPVRHRDLQKNVKREFVKLVGVLQVLTPVLPVVCASTTCWAHGLNGPTHLPAAETKFTTFFPSYLWQCMSQLLLFTISRTLCEEDKDAGFVHLAAAVAPNFIHKIPSASFHTAKSYFRLLFLFLSHLHPGCRLML